MVLRADFDELSLLDRRADWSGNMSGNGQRLGGGRAVRVCLVILWASACAVTAEAGDQTCLTADSNARLSPGQSHYLENCGGCHGIQGSSWKRDIPELRGAVGQFLCTAAGREYIVRLPNVAFANMDDGMLTEVMNFVVFGLGGSSVPAGAKPYSRGEVAALRRQPLKNRQLAALRMTILAEAGTQCGTGMR
jgi:hypothetical protein